MLVVFIINLAMLARGHEHDPWTKACPQFLSLDLWVRTLLSSCHWICESSRSCYVKSRGSCSTSSCTPLPQLLKLVSMDLWWSSRWTRNSRYQQINNKSKNKFARYLKAPRQLGQLLNNWSLQVDNLISECRNKIQAINNTASLVW